MNRFNPYITHINTDFLKALCLHEGKLVQIRKGECPIKESEVFPYFGFVEKGIFKYVCTNQSEQRRYNVGFVFPNEFIADYPACLYGIKSECDVEALTPCTVYFCPAERLNQLYEQDVERQRIARVNAEQLFLQTYSRYLDLYRLTPEERYKQLLIRCPEIIQLIQLKEIASYLQITPIHLSRIRKRITFQK